MASLESGSYPKKYLNKKQVQLQNYLNKIK
jgi:hypothetical protein